MNLQKLVRKVRFEEVSPILKQISRWADEEMLYFRIGYDLAGVIEGEVSDNPIVIARGENRDGICASACSCEGNWLEHNLLREIRIEDGLRLSDAEIVACILNDTSYLSPCRSICRNLLPNKYADRLEAMDARDQRFYSHLPRHRYKMAVRRDSESVISATHENRVRRNRAKRMRDHRRALLRGKYERLSGVQEHINDIVGARCGVAEQDLHYLFAARTIISDTLCAAQCAENERIEYLFDRLLRYGNEAYRHIDSAVLVFTTDTASPLTVTEYGRVREWLDRMAPLQRVMILNEQIPAFGPYIDMQITGSCAG